MMKTSNSRNLLDLFALMEKQKHVFNLWTKDTFRISNQEKNILRLFLRMFSTIQKHNQHFGGWVSASDTLTAAICVQYLYVL